MAGIEGLRGARTLAAKLAADEAAARMSLALATIKTDVALPHHDESALLHHESAVLQLLAHSPGWVDVSALIAIAEELDMQVRRCSRAVGCHQLPQHRSTLSLSHAACREASQQRRVYTTR